MNIHEEYSDEIELPFALAQGSCTGPYLFVLYCSTINTMYQEQLAYLATPMTMHSRTHLMQRTEMMKIDV